MLIEQLSFGNRYCVCRNGIYLNGKTYWYAERHFLPDDSLESHEIVLCYSGA